MTDASLAAPPHRTVRPSRNHRPGLLAIALASWLAGCSIPGVTPAGPGQPQGNPDRKAASQPATAPAWARRLARPGLPNLHGVSASLYRGARPNKAGFAQLKVMGVRTVVNLESFHGESDEAAAVGLGYEHIFMKSWHPELEDVARFLRIVRDPARGPVFVHCQRGADRTGMMCAIYRIVIGGWPKDRAIDEMKDGGFDFDPNWANLEQFIMELDVEQLRRELSPPATQPSS